MLEQLVLISQEMVRHAEQGEWAKLDELQQHRDGLIKNGFPLDVARLNVRQAADQIQAILELDKQTLQLAKARHGETRQAIRRLSHGRVATRAYQNTSHR